MNFCYRRVKKTVIRWFTHQTACLLLGLANVSGLRDQRRLLGASVRLRRPAGAFRGPRRRERRRLAGPRHGTLSEARSRLDRRRFSRPNTHFSAFFKIYKKIIFSRANFVNFCQKIENFAKFLTFFGKINLISQNFAKFSEIRKIFAKFCRIF